MGWQLRCDDMLQFGDLTIDGPAWEVRFECGALELTKTEFALLYLLASQHQRVLGHRELVETLWGQQWAEGAAATLAVHVSRIRTKLARVGVNKRVLKTVRGVGYRWDGSLLSSDSSSSYRLAVGC